MLQTPIHYHISFGLGHVQFTVNGVEDEQQIIHNFETAIQEYCKRNNSSFESLIELKEQFANLLYESVSTSLWLND